MTKLEWLNAYNELSLYDRLDVDAMIAMGLCPEPCNLVTPSFVGRAIKRAIEMPSYPNDDEIVTTNEYKDFVESTQSNSDAFEGWKILKARSSESNRENEDE